MYASMWQMHHLKHLGNSRCQKKNEYKNYYLNKGKK